MAKSTTFALKIDCDNAAFRDPVVDDERPEFHRASICHEVARILEDTAKRLRSAHPSNGTLRDLNGNTVGDFRLTNGRGRLLD